MKKFIYIIFCFLPLLLTGCSIVQTETQEKILQCLEDNGYINSTEFSYTFEYKNTTLFVYTINYCHVYEDTFGDKYVVEIYSKKKDEEFYKVLILEDVDISEYDEGNNAYKYVKDYDIKTELKLEKYKKDFIIK